MTYALARGKVVILTGSTLHLMKLPEFADRVMQPCNDGMTYEEALKNGQDTLENLIEFYGQEGWELPQPRTLQTA
jgi:antitoxin HicB